MSAFARRYSRGILIAAVTYFAVTTVGLALGAHWREEDRAPSITLLGSGSRLSLLVVDDDVRLLIASGDDASAFGNALAEARNPTSRRIDVVVIDGGESSRAVAARVRRDFSDATTFVIDGDLAGQLADLDLDPGDVIARDTSVELTPDLDVSIYPEPGDDDGWYAVIRHRSTVVIAGSALMPPATGRQVSAFVFTGRFDATAAIGNEVRSVALPVGGASLSELQTEADRMGNPEYAVFVGDGVSVRLVFTDRGIELPASAVKLNVTATLKQQMAPS